MKAIPYARHHITPEDEEAVLRVLRSDFLTQGPEVPRFEEELAELAGARYAVAVNSGTAALHLAYLAAGAKPGAVVTMPAISFVATANGARMCGAVPRFLDVGADGLMFGDDRGDFQVVVSLGGQRPNVPTSHTILDAAHGPLCLYRALAACFSFHPCKHVAAGEGGAVVTNDEGFAQTVRTLRSHGRVGLYQWDLGFNYRMPEINAALARSQLTRYGVSVQRRRLLAERYTTRLKSNPRISLVGDNKSVRHLYQILVDDRDRVQKQLSEAGIQTAIHYPVIPRQPYYRCAGSWPMAERFAATTLSLPMFPTLTEEEVDFVAEKVLEAVG